MRKQLRVMLSRLHAAVEPMPLPKGPFKALRIGLVADELTRSCLSHECRIVDITPTNFEHELPRQRLDLLFVESAWHGRADAWKFGIAAYSEHPERNNTALQGLCAMARDLGIPTVFWNKEDGVHFERFIQSASLFETVFTVDDSCIPLYRERLGERVRLGVLPFAAQPALHRFSGIGERRAGACFVGSYDTRNHPGRLARQSMLLAPAADVLGLTVFDRNSDRRGSNYRYPPWPGVRVRPCVPHGRTAQIYKSHMVSLNVNTIEGSNSMFSRRLVEILACGGLAVSTPARAIDGLFKGCCHTIASREEALALFERLHRSGYDANDRAMIASAAELVVREHTYARRLGTVLDTVGRA